MPNNMQGINTVMRMDLKDENNDDMAMEVDEEGDEPPNLHSRFLDIFVLGLTLTNVGNGSTTSLFPGLLGWLDAANLCRAARLCRRSRELVLVEHNWEPRVRATCGRWQLPIPKKGTWRHNFFKLLRPRCDGIYVGECRYVHRIRLGTSLEAKSTRPFHWVDYRRYIRLLPPDENGTKFAFVLRDVCNFDVAAELLSKMDPTRQLMALAKEKLTAESRSSQAHLWARVAVGTWERCDANIEIRARCSDDQLYLTLKLSHGSDQRFSGRLDWAEYRMVDQEGDVTTFNLGRSPDGDGRPLSTEKDHYPPMYIRTCPKLEHLL
mmetsp:Transcript_58998/g.125086  ORF Transcript_58998/g.125086 Transcript_58998/m.125086 type:complete len:321 (-) Transcript_58998:161-1123(-)|eukprot:CAMPEP_0206493882 /NCGR_PEP_ID=MMETSP0324_2-20121206/47322_1 /ASSEMBLY_ACC=CAM_ASM_000836 /TAXON_ID=2866 /ORGANISM="Crypthecodinium cohnii, Strain Seligo" /LENGTH=320 /DNA_ID=CAMNT_0053977281 /DNA_START=189 /DNA_END=1151 /DNA_ORIENTATION=+